jgi:AraC-like DNA-binding protein
VAVRAGRLLRILGTGNARSPRASREVEVLTAGSPTPGIRITGLAAIVPAYPGSSADEDLPGFSFMIVSVKSRQPIRRVPFAAPLPLGMEVMTLARLRAMAPPNVLSRPLRPAFHSLLFISGGAATLGVDFVGYRLVAGSVLWSRPGQVQQFGDEWLAGDLVIFQPDFLIPGTRAATVADDPLRRTSVHGAPARSATDRTRQALRRAYAEVARRGEPTVAETETLQHLLSVLILGLVPGVPDTVGTESRGLDARFRVLLERDFRTAHGVDHYARQLGYSLRTLNRATQTAAGESPKQAVSRRLVLEARRLLAYTDRPVATIARELGFTDPSNFSTFFARQTHEAPSTFRIRAKSGPNASCP